MRDKVDRPPTENGDRLFHEITAQSRQQPQFSFADSINNTVDATFKEATPAQKLIDSKLFTDSKKKGLADRFEKALTKQLNEYADKLEKMDELPKKVELKNIESFYAFNVLTKDLKSIADKAIEDFNKDKRVKHKTVKKFSFEEALTPEESDEIFGDYPDFLKDWIINRTAYILKGGTYQGESYAGVDEETSAQINTLISNNLDKGTLEVARLIRDIVPDMSRNRAKTIAQTELSNAYEGSQFELYKREFQGGKKDYQTVNDEFVRPSCQDDESEGLIDLLQEFGSGVMRGGEKVNCRCHTNCYPPSNY